jgi:hypothetical protein
MGRFCYISQILPSKSELVREMWKKRVPNEEPAIHTQFWNYLGMTGFEGWLQQTEQGAYLIHCLEGESLQRIFKGLRELIAKGNSFAVKLQNFYQNVLGKNYASLEAEPHIESMLDIALPSSEKIVKRGFFFPLLSHKEEAHRLFRQESMGAKKERHETSMKAFGVSRLSTWLQSTTAGKYIVVYSERHVHTPTTPAARLSQAKGSSAWQEISSILCDHTGLKPDELSPDSEWLTQPK